MSVEGSVVPKIRVSADGMEAYLNLPRPLDEEPWTIEGVKSLLGAQRVSTGIDEEVLQTMIEGNIYGREMKVAVGEPPVNGTDGYYEFQFNSKFSKTPAIRPDGSVDYWSMNLIETVRKDQVIAVYHPAVQGHPGTNVHGLPVHEKRGRELPVLKGKGFEREEDQVTYVASIDGKITLVNDRITISPIYEIQGDVDISVGNIDFIGDVMIHGNVCNGVSIKSSGTITIDGVVEAAKICADKDIILRGGMLGGNKSTLFTKGNLFAQFVEYTTVEVAGNIEADVFMDCEVTCGGYITMNGKRAKIVSGHVYAAYGIDANDIGNIAEANTSIAVGVGSKEDIKLAEIRKRIKQNEEIVEKIEHGLHQFELAEQEKGISYQTDPRRMQLLRERIKYMAAINEDKDEEAKIDTLIKGAKSATVKVVRNVYPGVGIRIGDMIRNVKLQQSKREFVQRVDHIVMSELDDPSIV